MIKGLTLVRHVGSVAEHKRLASFFTALGFDPGKGWQNDIGSGVTFSTPSGKVEFVLGEIPTHDDAPEILIEVGSLDAVHSVASSWVEKMQGPELEQIGRKAIQPILTTTWNVRMFLAEPVPGMVFGFWESENPLHGRPMAIEGDLSAQGLRFGIVVARWNAVITDRLLQGALDALLRSGAQREAIRIVRVPGAWEIPAAARILAEGQEVDAVVTLGVLLRGETAHYEAIYTEVSRGIGQSQQETGVPHSFGVLTCETLEQALDRAGLKMGNKGFEAGLAAIEMANVYRKLKAGSETGATKNQASEG